MLIEKMQRFEKNADHGLSYDKLKYNINKKHPRIVKTDSKSNSIFYVDSIGGKVLFKKYPICKTKTGSNLCCFKARRSDLSIFGVGVTLYFQFLKFMIFAMFLLSFFSIPSYIFFYSGNVVGSKKGQDISNTKYVLTALSLGNIG